MKKGVRIINVARGGVIDEDALLRLMALDTGLVAQVYMQLSNHNYASIFLIKNESIQNYNTIHDRQH